MENLQLIRDGGIVVFALLALGALLTGRVRAKHEIGDRDKTIAYERGQKEAAFEMARASQASFDRLADAVKESNRLDAARLEAAKGGDR